MPRNAKKHLDGLARSRAHPSRTPPHANTKHQASITWGRNQMDPLDPIGSHWIPLEPVGPHWIPFGVQMQRCNTWISYCIRYTTTSTTCAAIEPVKPARGRHLCGVRWLGKQLSKSWHSKLENKMFGLWASTHVFACALCVDMFFAAPRPRRCGVRPIRLARHLKATYSEFCEFLNIYEHWHLNSSLLSVSTTPSQNTLSTVGWNASEINPKQAQTAIFRPHTDTLLWQTLWSQHLQKQLQRQLCSILMCSTTAQRFILTCLNHKFCLLLISSDIASQPCQASGSFLHYYPTTLATSMFPYNSFSSLYEFQTTLFS